MWRQSQDIRGLKSVSRINDAFSKGKAFIPFITGGDPDIETTEKLLYALCEAGADIIEIGVPFSDPVAEGPVIEAADERALSKGCTVDKLFDLVSRIRADIKIPLLFLTYYNPIFAYGVERFIKRCVDCGMDGLIVPDLPFEERDELLEPCKAQGIELISIISPSSEARIEKIVKNSREFLYCISSTDLSDDQNELGNSVKRMIEYVRSISNIPCAAGVDVSTPEEARETAEIADGVIIGTAIVEIAAKFGNVCVEPTREFAVGIKSAVKM